MTDDGVPRTDEELVGFCRSLGLPGLVDVHVHFMPERLLHKVWAYFDRVTSHGTAILPWHR